MTCTEPASQDRGPPDPQDSESAPRPLLPLTALLPMSAQLVISDRLVG